MSSCAHGGWRRLAQDSQITHWRQSVAGVKWPQKRRAKNLRTNMYNGVIMRRVMIVLGIMLLPEAVSAQSICLPLDATPAINPRTVRWTQSADHATVTSYHLDIIEATSGAVIATLDLGIGVEDPAAPGDREETINVQPIAFGEYCVVMRAVAGALESEDSAPSNTFVRRPGAPDMVTLR